MPPTERREEECKSSKYSFLPIEGFLSLCELVMNLSSHQIIVSWKERSSSDNPVNLILIFFSRSLKYLILSVNFRSVLICYTTLIWSGIPMTSIKHQRVASLMENGKILHFRTKRPDFRACMKSRVSIDHITSKLYLKKPRKWLFFNSQCFNTQGINPEAN